jgi:hypothetical protein
VPGGHAQGLEDAEVVDAVPGVQDDRVEDASDVPLVLAKATAPVGSSEALSEAR